jgi:hypothetical protein
MADSDSNHVQSTPQPAQLTPEKGSAASPKTDGALALTAPSQTIPRPTSPGPTKPCPTMPSHDRSLARPDLVAADRDSDSTYGSSGHDQQDPMVRLARSEIEALADRMLSRAVSVLSLDQPQVRADLITASRVLRGLLRAYERAAERPLETIFIIGGGL